MKSMLAFDTVTRLQHAFGAGLRERESNLLPVEGVSALAASVVHDVEAVLFIGPKDAHANWSAAKAVLAVNGKPAWEVTTGPPTEETLHDLQAKDPALFAELARWPAGWIARVFKPLGAGKISISGGDKFHIEFADGGENYAMRVALVLTPGGQPATKAPRNTQTTAKIPKTK